MHYAEKELESIIKTTEQELESKFSRLTNISNKILPCGDNKALGVTSFGISLEMSDVSILFKKSIQFDPEILRTFLFLR